MQAMITFSTVVVFGGALAGMLWLHPGHVPAQSLAMTCGFLLCLTWLVVVLTLPWNVYFQAKAVLFEMQRARERSIPVRPDREAEAHRVARRMLRVSIALHVGSALVAAAATAVSRERWGYVFSAVYLASGFLRPSVEYYRYLRRRLGHLVAEVTFPRQDVKALEAEVKQLRDRAEVATKNDVELRDHIAEVERGAEARHRDLEKRFMSLARTFEETVNRLTDNQQIIGGIKALLRLIQAGGEAAQLP